MLSLAMGVLLAVASQRCARALIVEPTGASLGNLSQQSATPDQKPSGNTAPVPATEDTDLASNSGQSAGAAGLDQMGQVGGNDGTQTSARNSSAKGKSQGQEGTQNRETKKAAGGPSGIQNAAVQLLKTLDFTIDALRKSGTLAPGSKQGKQGNDISARRDKLREQAQAAKDANAWAEVASGTAEVLGDAVQMMQTKNADSASSPAIENHNATALHAGEPHASQSTRLPLYVAGVSLILSVLGLGSGWLIARREINKALVDAGLL
jgi:hypothetical protein